MKKDGFQIKFGMTRSECPLSFQRKLESTAYEKKWIPNQVWNDKTLLSQEWRNAVFATGTN